MPMTQPHTRDSGRAGRTLVILAGAALAAVFAGHLSGMQAEPPAGVARPTERLTNCLDGNCHAEQQRHRFLHGPNAIGACDSCHVYDDPKAHTFRDKRQGPDLCGFCHVGKQAGRYVHQPIEDGRCVDCHDPHGAANREMVRAETVGHLCASCHADVIRGREHAHGPVASGNCSACHNSHASDFPHLLTGEGHDFCIGCHKEMGQQLEQVAFVHQPARGDCLRCHASHASDHVMQLKEPPLSLCVSCHPRVRDESIKAEYRHTVVVAGEACMNCHTAHGSDLYRLLQDHPVEGCLACHDKPVVNPRGQIVEAVPEVAREGLVKHGPIREGNCSGCHRLHGSGISRLLAEPYPDTFYQPYETEKYALCFSCHEQQLATTERTTTLTDFRNGDLNLHFLHVNKPRRGRSCRSCHSTHASKYAVHIRETVPYGQWEMPVAFTPSETGGTCTPGCHRTAAYDRVTPAPPPEGIPPDEPAAVAGAGREAVKPPADPAPHETPAPGNTPPQTTPEPAPKTAPDTAPHEAAGKASPKPTAADEGPASPRAAANPNGEPGTRAPGTRER
jgi:predicted CXXCH cytochrome family protein